MLISIIYIITITIYDVFINKKILSLVTIILIIINLVKFDKLLHPLFDNYKFYISKEKINDFDLEAQPLKLLAKNLNKNLEYKNKKIFLLTKHHIPKYAFFDAKTAFWSWHSFGTQMDIIKYGNLEKALKKNRYNFLIIEKSFEENSMSRFFNDNPFKIGKEFYQFENYIIFLINN